MTLASGTVQNGGSFSVQVRQEMEVVISVRMTCAFVCWPLTVSVCISCAMNRVTSLMNGMKSARKRATSTWCAETAWSRGVDHSLCF